MSATPLPAGNPRPTEDALQWQLDRVGSTAWEGWSLKFQRMAHGFAVESTVSDIFETLRWLTTHGSVAGGEPPRGMLAWYADSDEVSVMSSLGGGRIVGPGVGGTVGVMDYRERDGYLGWSQPIFPFAT